MLNTYPKILEKGKIKLIDLRMGDKFYSLDDDLIYVVIAVSYDENKPNEIKYSARRLNSNIITYHTIHSDNAKDLCVYKYTGRNMTSFLAGYRYAMNRCIKHMGLFDRENAGFNDNFKTHMTMLEDYKRWITN
jgi:hypothetical protein